MTGRTIKLLVSIIVVALLAVWVCSAVCAQGGGGGNGGGGRANRGGFGGMGMGGFGGGAPVVKVGAQGIFVMTGGTLTKFDTKLKQQGTLTFTEPAPPPSTDTSADTSTQPRRQMAPRGGVVMIAPNADASKEKVLVVFGTDFFSIDAASFKVIAKCKLPDIEPPAGAPAADPNAAGGGMGGRMMGGFFGTPTLELNGNTVYVIRGSQMVAINIDDATVIGKATLPQQAPPMAPANPGN